MFTVHTKQWGNSLGIIIPAEIVRECQLKPHQDIVVEIKEKTGNVLGELFGSVKFSKEPRLVVKEARFELESKR